MHNSGTAKCYYLVARVLLLYGLGTTADPAPQLVLCTLSSRVRMFVCVHVQIDLRD